LQAWGHGAQAQAQRKAAEPLAGSVWIHNGDRDFISEEKLPAADACIRIRKEDFSRFRVLN